MSETNGFEIILHEKAMEIRLPDSKSIETSDEHRIVDDLIEYVQRQQPANLVINFTNVQHCATVAINGLLTLRRLLGADDVKLKICNVRAEVRHTLEILNLVDSVFEIYPSLADAIGAT